jgi:hypothetical protein
MQPEDLASKSFEPVTDDRRTAGGANSDPKTRYFKAVGSFIETQHPLARKALMRKDPVKILP